MTNTGQNEKLLGGAGGKGQRRLMFSRAEGSVLELQLRVPLREVVETRCGGTVTVGGARGWCLLVITLDFVR